MGAWEKPWNDLAGGFQVKFRHLSLRFPTKHHQARRPIPLTLPQRGRAFPCAAIIASSCSSLTRTIRPKKSWMPLHTASGALPLGCAPLATLRHRDPRRLCSETAELQPASSPLASTTVTTLRKYSHQHLIHHHPFPPASNAHHFLLSTLINRLLGLGIWFSFGDTSFMS